MIIRALQSLGSRLPLFRRERPKQALISYRQGRPFPYTDTQTAIDELSRLAKNTPEAVEVFLALGNLHRAQGDFERAIRVRKTLTARPDLEPQYRAKSLYELGLDYRRAGFLDRAGEAFEKSRELTGDDPVLLEEMAGLAAASGEYSTAADYYRLLKNPLAQSHYLVQQAKAETESDRVVTDKTLLKKAIRTYPGSAEAWLEILIRDCSFGAWSSMASDFRQALKHIDPGLCFVLLEGLIRYLVSQKDENEIFTPNLAPEPAQVLLDALAKREPDPILSYYAAWLALQLADTQLALSWLHRCLDLDADFWPARVELVALQSQSEELSLEFKAQLDIIFRYCRRQRRFLCRACGLRREQIFFLCSRCHSWHSIAFVK
ncbi:MAG: tetratricopeptide repeat protein [Desulfohalobiaceae bacterium]|nr:tetratricopeptide repeat protein [Desulfohalobiaceae bacterium]